MLIIVMDIGKIIVISMFLLYDSAILYIGVHCIVLIRMPKGHNHADQDGKFGVIWLYVRDDHLLSPQEYKAAVVAALKHDLGGCTVEDIVVLPDYVQFLAGCRDSLFGQADKMEYTQHVWRFQKVQVRCLRYTYYVDRR
jgi:hypothetical protein